MKASKVDRALIQTLESFERSNKEFVCSKSESDRDDRA